MGRFSLRDDDADDGGERNWEFVARPGEDGAMVLREQQQQQQTSDTSMTRDESFSSASRPWTIQNNPLEHVASMDQPLYYEGEVAYSNNNVKPYNYWLVFWKRSLIMLLLAWLVQTYLPPAPPVMDDSQDGNNNMTNSWNEFLVTHSSQLLHSLNALVIQTPLHVGHWISLSLYHEGQLWYERQQIVHCTLREPSPKHFDRLQQSVVGQDTAVRIVADAVQTWQWQHDTQKRRPPLVLFWTGFSSVGKTTLAYELARHVLFACPEDALPVLEISSQDFGVDWMHRILQHVERYPTGSMILLQRVEDMAPDLLVWLVRTLSSSTSLLPPPGSDTLAWPEDCCANAVFVLTSSTVGRNAITRTLRKQNGVIHHTDATFLADLRHEVDLHFSSSSSSTNNNNNAAELDSRHTLDAVVPFGPLTREHLANALRLRVAQLSPQQELVVTHAAVDAVLDPTRVEYLEWKRRDHANAAPVLFMTVAMDGAQVLDDKSSPLWKQLVAQIHQCLVDGRGTASTRLQTAVVDYNGAAIVLKWCTSRDDLDNCQEACRFSI